MSRTFRAVPHNMNREDCYRNQTMTFADRCEHGLMRNMVKHNPKRFVQSPILPGWTFEDAGVRRGKPGWKRFRERLTRRQGKRLTVTN